MICYHFETVRLICEIEKLQNGNKPNTLADVDDRMLIVMLNVMMQFCLLPCMMQYICHASARPPAFQSTAPHFPSSLDGIRNRKALNGSHSSECGNRTPPSKSDTAQSVVDWEAGHS